MRQQEVSCFLSALQISESQLTAVNIPYDKLNADLFCNTDVFLVGGAGDYSVLDSWPFLSGFFDFLNEICEKGVPMFASCFGFQALCLALGGRVVADPQNAEVGTFEMQLTEAGKADGVFGRLPEKFNAQMGHKDRAENLPAGVVHLVFSEKVFYQAFKLPERPIYATQFHPELTVEQNRQRFNHYLHQYSQMKAGIEIEQIRNSFRETQEANSLLQWFVDEIVQKSDTLRGSD